MHLENLDIQTVISALSVIVSVLATGWRLALKINRAIDQQNLNVEAIKKLGAAMGSINAKVAQIGEKYAEIKNDIGKLSVGLKEREKDIGKIEGRIDQIGTLMLNQVAAVKEATSSLDAVWRTLQGLYPDKVPKRLSDRKYETG